MKITTQKQYTSHEQLLVTQWLGVGLIVLIALMLRWWNLGTANLWTDEALTELRAQAPFNVAMDSLLTAGNQAPLYYLLLRWLPNESEYLLRLPSMVMGVFGVILTIQIVTEVYHNRTLGLWAGALVAVSPYHIMLSRTARSYALLLVLALLSFYFFTLVLRGHNRKWIWIGLGISSGLAYLTHYSATSIVVAQFLILGSSRRTRNWWITQTLALIPLMIWLVMVVLSLDGKNFSWFTEPNITALPVTLWNMLFGYDGTFEWYLLPALIVGTIGLGSGIYYALRDRRIEQENHYWVVLIVGLLITALVISWLLTPAYKDRYFIVFFPGVMVLFIYGWNKIASPNTTQIMLIVIFFTSLVNILIRFEEGGYERTDWDGAAEFIESQIQPEDGVMFERWNTSFIFHRYYDGETRLMNVHYLNENPSDLRFEKETDRMWVIFRNPIEDFHMEGQMPDFNPFEPSPSPMDEWLNKRRDRIIKIAQFDGVLIVLLENGD